MAGPIRIRVETDARAAGAEIDSLSDKTQRAGSRFAGFGKAAALGLLGAGAAAVKLGADMVSSASDAQQSLGATRTVFGKYADDVIKRSKDAASAIGVSANEYRELSNVVGASLSGAGVPLKRAADLTDQLNTRAADLAATFGGSTKDAVEAFSSLLRGEADPIERYGISVKRADVNARLAAKGQDELTGAALKQAEMQARLDLAFQQSSKSAGAFSRESDTLANRQQILSAKVEDLKAKVGAELLPVLTSMATWMLDKGLPAAHKLGGELADRFGPTVSAIAGFIGGQLIPVIVNLAQNVLAGARAMFDNIKAAMDRNSGTIQELRTWFSSLWAFLRDNLLPLLGRLAENVFPIIGEAIGVLVDGVGVLMDIFRNLWNLVLQPVIRLMLNGFGAVLDGWGALLQALGKVPGFEWAKTAGDKMRAAADEARGLAEEINKIPPRKDITIHTTYTYSGLRGPGGQGPTRGGDDDFAPSSRTTVPAPVQRVVFSAEERHQLERGRDVYRDIEAYKLAGGLT